MTLNGIRLCLIINVVFIVVFSIRYIFIGKHWNTSAITILSIYSIIFLILILLFTNKKEAIRKEQLLNELLIDEEL